MQIMHVMTNGNPQEDNDFSQQWRNWLSYGVTEFFEMLKEHFRTFEVVRKTKMQSMRYSGY
jgi:hypothetical protein